MNVVFLSGCMHAGNNGHEHSGSPNSCLLHDGLTAQGFTVQRSSLPNADAVAVAVAVAAVPLIILAAACKGTAVQQVLFLRKQCSWVDIVLDLFDPMDFHLSCNPCSAFIGWNLFDSSLIIRIGRQGFDWCLVPTYRLVKLSLRCWKRGLSLKRTIQAA